MATMPPPTIPFPVPLPAVRAGGGWRVTVDDVQVAASNLDKPYWVAEGYTKGDLLAYYFNIARWILPYLRDRPLTLKRMPDGADGEFFYAKRAPEYTPEWVSTAPVVSLDDHKRIDYLLAQDTASLLWLANLGCIEVHPWHARVDRIGRPDYAFFDLDPFDVGFATVRGVASLIGEALERLGLRSYPRTSGATGIQVYVPIDRVHSAAAVRRWVERVCRLVHRADPDRTTMEWSIAERSGKVYLDYGMNTEGKNIAAVYSLRPEREAPVATPLTWDEVATDVRPQDFTIATIWQRLARVGDLHAPVLEGGQDLRAAMEAVGLDPSDDDPPSHRVAARGADGADPRAPDALARYRERRDFARTPEPAPTESAPTEPAPTARTAGPDAEDRRFVIQHHLATRLHHDLRLEHEGVAPSWAVPKGLPDVAGLRHLAVRTEDHPVEYMTFSGDIPAGEYGGGPVRIWDSGTYDLLEWREDKVTVRLHGRRHDGEFHLFRTDEAKPSQWMVVRVGEPERLPAPPPVLAPMLASDGGGSGFDDPGWRFEVKWDGIRAIVTTERPGTGDPGATRLVSRAGNVLDPAYPEFAGMWERVLARNAVFDAEIVALDREGRPSFQLLQRRMHVRGSEAVERMRREVPATLMVFDLLAADGRSLCELPLSERLERLRETLVPNDRIRINDGVVGEGEAFFAAARDHGLEGLIAKRLTSPYRPGARTRDWLKLKVRQRAACVIGGWMPGAGGRSGRLGSLLVGCYAEGRLRYLGRVGTGFDEAELARLGVLLDERASDRAPFAEGGPLPKGARWVRPDLVCRVEYGEVTDGGILRAPSYKGLVAEADPRGCLVEHVDTVRSRS
jgi:bifunctional non-homologous end joining protein LigD